MRIDPSQLSEPLAHILGAGATDASQGQKAARSAVPIEDPQLERLDQMLLKRLQASSTAGAASSVVSFQQAQDRMDQIKAAAAADPGSTARAHGSLDSSRVRGLLGG